MCAGSCSLRWSLEQQLPGLLLERSWWCSSEERTSDLSSEIAEQRNEEEAGRPGVHVNVCERALSHGLWQRMYV